MKIEHREEFNGLIKAIFRGGKINKINWGESFDTWPKDRQLEYAMETASAMNQAADIIQNERNDLLAQLNSLAVNMKNLETALDINKTIMRNSITEANKVKEANAIIVKDLETIIKALRLELLS